MPHPSSVRDTGNWGYMYHRTRQPSHPTGLAPILLPSPFPAHSPLGFSSHCPLCLRLPLCPNPPQLGPHPGHSVLIQPHDADLSQRPSAAHNATADAVPNRKVVGDNPGTFFFFLSSSPLTRGSKGPRACEYLPNRAVEVPCVDARLKHVSFRTCGSP